MIEAAFFLTWPGELSGSMMGYGALLMGFWIGVIIERDRIFFQKHLDWWRVIASGVIGMILFVGCGKNEGQKIYEVINKNGVDIYVNKKKPADVTATLELKHLLTILGDIDTEDSTRMFNEIEDLEVDSEGNIFLFEARKGKIMKFDKSGKYITSFGKLGNGPGEFPFAFDLVSVEDTLYVKSFTNKQMVKFDNNGKYIQKLPYTSG